MTNFLRVLFASMFTLSAVAVAFADDSAGVGELDDSDVYCSSISAQNLEKKDAVGERETESAQSDVSSVGTI